MKKTPINPFDSNSENRYKAFEEMRAEAPVHEVVGGDWESFAEEEMNAARANLSFGHE